MTKSYRIGYGKPPKGTRFKKGQSGNPKGRPKRAKNLKTVLLNDLNETLPVKERNKQMQLSKLEVIIKQLNSRTAKGDPKAWPTWLSLMAKAGLINSEEENWKPPSKEDREIIAEFLDRHMYPRPKESKQHFSGNVKNGPNKSSKRKGKT